MTGKRLNMTDDCPCGSGATYTECCAPCLSGSRPAATAEALMRSRYCAYLQCDSTYLLRTWHPATRPAALDLQADDIQWLGLQVLDSQQGTAQDDQGTVSFIAHYRQAGRSGQLQERSRFHKLNGEWYYLDGVHGQQADNAGSTPRNAPCPCGSGRKFKRCCGR